MLECFKDCFLLVGWANEFLALALPDVVIESFLKTAFLFDLGNVEGGHIQTEVFQNICLYLWIGSGGSCGRGQVCNIDVKVDMLVYLLPTQTDNRFYMAALGEHIHGLNACANIFIGAQKFHVTCKR